MPTGVKDPLIALKKSVSMYPYPVLLYTRTGNAYGIGEIAGEDIELLLETFNSKAPIIVLREMGQTPRYFYVLVYPDRQNFEILLPDEGVVYASPRGIYHPASPVPQDKDEDILVISPYASYLRLLHKGWGLAVRPESEGEDYELPEDFAEVLAKHIASAKKILILADTDDKQFAESVLSELLKREDFINIDVKIYARPHLYAYLSMLTPLPSSLWKSAETLDIALGSDTITDLVMKHISDRTLRVAVLRKLLGDKYERIYKTKVEEYADLFEEEEMADEITKLLEAQGLAINPELLVVKIEDANKTYLQTPEGIKLRDKTKEMVFLPLVVYVDAKVPKDGDLLLRVFFYDLLSKKLNEAYIPHQALYDKKEFAKVVFRYLGTTFKEIDRLRRFLLLYVMQVSSMLPLLHVIAEYGWQYITLGDKERLKYITPAEGLKKDEKFSVIRFVYHNLINSAPRHFAQHLKLIHGLMLGTEEEWEKIHKLTEQIKGIKNLKDRFLARTMLLTYGFIPIVLGYLWEKNGYGDEYVMRLYLHGFYAKNWAYLIRSITAPPTVEDFSDRDSVRIIGQGEKKKPLKRGVEVYISPKREKGWGLRMNAPNLPQVRTLLWGYVGLLLAKALEKKHLREFETVEAFNPLTQFYGQTISDLYIFTATLHYIQQFFEYNGLPFTDDFARKVLALFSDLLVLMHSGLSVPLLILRIDKRLYPEIFTDSEDDPDVVLVDVAKKLPVVGVALRDMPFFINQLSEMGIGWLQKSGYGKSYFAINIRALEERAKEMLPSRVPYRWKGKYYIGDKEFDMKRTEDILKAPPVSQLAWKLMML